MKNGFPLSKQHVASFCHATQTVCIQFLLYLLFLLSPAAEGEQQQSPEGQTGARSSWGAVVITGVDQDNGRSGAVLHLPEWQ